MIEISFVPKSSHLLECTGNAITLNLFLIDFQLIHQNQYIGF